MRSFRSTLLIGTVAALAACSDNTTSPSLHPEGAPVLLSRGIGQAIPGHYIVVVKEGADPRSVAAVAGVGNPRHVYESALNGFAAALNDGQLNALRHNPNVAYIEQDQVATATTIQNMDAAGDPWGLDRISQRDLPLNGAYGYVSTGAGVRAYVIDTGIQANHPEFGSRGVQVVNFMSDGMNYDCNGHGTHVAGTIGGNTYGVGKEVLVRGVKVLDCNGWGTASTIIAGIDWVRTNHIKPAVANMSLALGYSQATNDATNNLASAGVFVAVAAGNSNADACNASPASAVYATTTAASDKADYKASFSNYGSCVDLYAPGVAIKSSWINSSTNKIGGTSMASPHVAGVAALYKSKYGDGTSYSIDKWIKDNSSLSKIKGNITGTPNRLLYNGGL